MYTKSLQISQDSVGALQEQQDIYMESTAAHLQTLKAAVENIYDSLADTDSINSIADGLAVAANLTANLIDSLGGGSAVLKSLGAIGVTVFSEQIAKGINTTITNTEIITKTNKLIINDVFGLFSPTFLFIFYSHFYFIKIIYHYFYIFTTNS